MQITRITGFILEEVVKNQVYNVSFNNLARGEETKTSINVEGADYLSVTKSCGCTKPSIDLNTDGTFNINIAYDSNKVGAIKQWVKLKVQLKDTKETKEIIFNLKGTIL